MNDTDARLWHPWLRINRVLRAMLHERWSAEAWPQVKGRVQEGPRAEESGPARRLVQLAAVARRPAKKHEPEQPATTRVLPMQLKVGDRLVDETGEWEITVRPYTSPGGKNVHARVRRMDQPATAEDRTWGAHERIAVKRATAEEGK